MTTQAHRPRHVVAQARSIIDEYDAAGPHAAGRVRQAVGGLLVADGLVGLPNPLDKKKKRPGVVGGIFLVLIGLAFVSAATWGLGGAPDTDATTVGEITSVEITRPRKPCSLTGTFTVAGQDYDARSRVGSSDHCTREVGSPIEVDYSSIDPRINEIEGGTGTGLFYGFLVAGGLVCAWGVRAFVTGLGSIVVGARLRASGKRQAEGHPPRPGDDGIVEEARARLTAAITGS